MWSDEVNPEIFNPSTLSPRPVRDLSTGFFNMVYGEEVLPSKEESDAGSVSRFTPPDLSKTLNANHLSFCFSDALPKLITSHNHNIFRDHFSNVCYGTSIGESSRGRDKIRN